MSGGLAEIREAMCRFAASFDPALITAADAERVVAVAARIEAAAATVKALAAARAAESSAWRQRGARTPAHELARKTGSSVGEAMRVLETGSRLARQPEVLARAAAGELSAEQAAVVSDAVAERPGAAGRLLEVAANRSLAELRQECAAVKAAGDAGGEARRRRIHDARSLRTWAGRDGAAHLHLVDNPERVAAVVAGIAPARERLFARARVAGKRERADALDADALVETVTRTPAAAPSGRSTEKILVRVDWDALLRGYPIDGEVCEIAGSGPVAVGAVRDMIATGDPFLAAVATRGRQVVGVAHLGRRPTAHQLTALQWRDPACAVEGCPRQTRLQNDHREPWADSKITLVDVMDRLCEHHHALKTHHGWALLAGAGKRPFVPPGDPRHPRSARDRSPPGQLVS